MTPRYKDNSDEIDNFVNHLVTSSSILQEDMKQFLDNFLSTSNLTKALTKERALKLKLDQLHSLYSAYNIAKDLGREQDLPWFELMIKNTKNGYLQIVDSVSSSSDSDDDSSSDDESSSSDDDKKLPAK